MIPLWRDGRPWLDLVNNSFLRRACKTELSTWLQSCLHGRHTRGTTINISSTSRAPSPSYPQKRGNVDPNRIPAEVFSGRSQCAWNPARFNGRQANKKPCVIINTICLFFRNGTSRLFTRIFVPTSARILLSGRFGNGSCVRGNVVLLLAPSSTTWRTVQLFSSRSCPGDAVTVFSLGRRKLLPSTNTYNVPTMLFKIN